MNRLQAAAAVKRPICDDFQIVRQSYLPKADAAGKGRPIPQGGHARRHDYGLELFTSVKAAAANLRGAVFDHDMADVFLRFDGAVSVVENAVFPNAAGEQLGFVFLYVAHFHGHPFFLHIDSFPNRLISTVSIVAEPLTQSRIG